MCNSSANVDATDNDEDDTGCCGGLLTGANILADEIVSSEVTVGDAVGVDADLLILSVNDSAALSLFGDVSDDGEELFEEAIAVAISKFFFLDARASCSAKLIIIVCGRINYFCKGALLILMYEENDLMKDDVGAHNEQ